jgi:hypothetical protein
VEFESDLVEALTGSDPLEKVKDRIETLTGHDFTLIEIPSGGASRAEMLKEIVHLEVRVINLVTIELRKDTQKLMPLDWDSASVKRQKLGLVRRDEQERRSLWKRAVENSETQKSMREVSVSGPQYRNSDVRFNDNEALRQAIKIHVTGTWGGT